MRYYVAGCGGMLGEAVHRVFVERGDTLKCTDIDLNASWLEYCDFRDFDAYARSVRDFAPDMLVHLGAHTDLEYCERNPEDAYRTNAESVAHAAKIADEAGIALVYISTAGIFDGTKEVYDEDDRPNPLGVYARSKYQGEQIASRNPRHFIGRAGWMMGGGFARDKKFIGKLLRQLASGRRELQIVNDKLGTPTYTVDFARNLRELIDTQHYGLYNMVCAGGTSRLEVAHELLSILGLDRQVMIESVSSEHFAAEYFAPRPDCERLTNRRLDGLGLNRMRDWRVALADYIADYYADFAAGLNPDTSRPGNVTLAGA